MCPFVTGGNSHSCHSAANPRDCLWGGTSSNGAVFSMPLGAGWHCALALILLYAGGKEKGVRPAPTLPLLLERGDQAPAMGRWLEMPHSSPDGHEDALPGHLRCATVNPPGKKTQRREGTSGLSKLLQ